MKEQMLAIKRILTTVLFFSGLILLPKLSFAVDASPVKMDDMMWSNGKIYVVVLVVFTIFLGIIITLIFLERRIKRLEKNQS